MVDILSIRDPESLKSDPNLNIIREATIQYFDHLVEDFDKDKVSKREFNTLVSKLKRLLNGESSLINEALDEGHFSMFADLREALEFVLDFGFKTKAEMLARFEEIEGYLFFECLTSGRCFASVRSLGDYILEKYPDTFEVYPLVIKGELENFGAHAILVLKDKKSGQWYMSNPSNIFDFPETSDNVEFQRAIHILRADSYNLLSKSIIELEGGELPDEKELDNYNISTPGIVF